MLRFASFTVALCAIGMLGTGCGLLLDLDPEVQGGDAGALDAAVSDAAVPDGAGRDATSPDATIVDPLCRGLAEWDECNPTAAERWVCIAGECILSRCGDGIADAVNLEECDDGNFVDDDGCTSECLYTCEEDAECIDDAPCNGEETCTTDTHTCEIGTPLADGTICPTTEGEGYCRAGRCAAATCGNSTVDPGEECDDGNTDDTDGCRNDCTWECVRDDECLSTSCTIGTCDTTAHTCIDALRDGDMDGFPIGGACGGDDCDDTNPAINPSATEVCDLLGIDEDCDGAINEGTARPLRCTIDGDMDGWGGIGALTRVCGSACPGSFAPIGDCDDADPAVNPDQTMYFSMSTRLGNYDYDCNLMEELRWTRPAACAYDVSGDCGGSGWQLSGGLTAPLCGAPGQWVVCGEETPGSCEPTREMTRLQECR